VGVYVKCVHVGGLDPKKGERGTMGWWKVNYVLPVLRVSSLTLLLWQGMHAGGSVGSCLRWCTLDVPADKSCTRWLTLHVGRMRGGGGKCVTVRQERQAGTQCQLGWLGGDKMGMRKRSVMRRWHLHALDLARFGGLRF